MEIHLFHRPQKLWNTLNVQTKTLFTYLHNFLSSWDLQELYNVVCDLIKLYNGTKHGIPISYMNQKKQKFSLLWTLCFKFVNKERAEPPVKAFQFFFVLERHLFNIYLKGRERQSEIFHLLFHSPNPLNCQGGLEKAEARSGELHLGPHVGGRGRGTHAASPRVYLQGAAIRGRATSWTQTPNTGFRSSDQLLNYYTKCLPCSIF